MSRKRPHLCASIGCRRLTLGKFCEEHAATRRLYMSDWEKESKRFLHSAAWLNLRDLKISQTPWCEECAKTKPLSVPATQIDHIKPRRTHPALALDIANLQSLCDECHGKKTRRGE